MSDLSTANQTLLDEVKSQIDDHMQWAYVNAYRKLVAQGLATDFRCHSCKDRAIVIMKDEKVVVKCFNCNSTTVPNKDWWSRLKAIVKEHNAAA